ncbi:hypothetical protein, partial [Bartonella sp. AP331QHHD]|uniref:hypothetical protein n=1 Tax=Bartonella sp. AP331QHHD TaxID=3243490 RepID=UPI0035D118FE
PPPQTTTLHQAQQIKPYLLKNRHPSRISLQHPPYPYSPLIHAHSLHPPFPLFLSRHTLNN